MKAKDLLNIIGINSHEELIHVVDEFLKYQIEEDFDYIKNKLGIESKDDPKIKNLSFMYRTGILSGLGMAYASYTKSIKIFALTVKIIYKYTTYTEVDDDNYENRHPELEYNLGLFTTYKEAAEVGNNLIESCKLDHKSTPGINGERFIENYLYGSPRYIIRYPIFNENDKIVGYITFRIKPINNMSPSEILEMIKVLRTSEINELNDIIGKVLPITNKYEVINSNATWADARDALRKGLIVSHRNYKNLELRCDKDGIFTSNMDSITNRIIWFELHKTGEWEDGFIIKKLSK